MNTFDNTIERRVEDRRMSSGEKILRTQLYQAQSKICELEEEIKSAPVTPQADMQPWAWIVESPSELEPITAVVRTKEYADRYGEARWTVTPVYTHVDAGEVPILKRELEIAAENVCTVEEERDGLRTELAEALAEIQRLRMPEFFNTEPNKNS